MNTQAEKSQHYQELKAAGVEFKKHYREYTVDELRLGVQKLREAQAEAAATETVEPPPAPSPAPQAEQVRTRSGVPPMPTAPVRERDPNEFAGQRLNQLAFGEPLRTDEYGRVWFQEEVAKPAYPKPRGRRVLKYNDTGTKQVETKDGQFSETFEIAGDRAPVPAEIKITLPSYQVGIYVDPRFKHFRTICYSGNEGFALEDVQAYYGGAEQVPAEVKRKYVANVLCYDIRTVVRDIQAQYRRLQLANQPAALQI